MDCLERIQELLRERDWSMYQLSQRAGIPQSTLSNLFIRYNAPTIPTLEKICGALGITLSEFFRDTSTPTSEDERILAEWHRLSPEGKDALLKLLSEINNG